MSVSAWFIPEVDKPTNHQKNQKGEDNIAPRVGRAFFFDGGSHHFALGTGHEQFEHEGEGD